MKKIKIKMRYIVGIFLLVICVFAVYPYKDVRNVQLGYNSDIFLLEAGVSR